MESKREQSFNPKRCNDAKEWMVDIFTWIKIDPAGKRDLENCGKVCICQVPESLSSSKREAFIPQFVGLGPYHHSRDGLIMTMEMKLAAAERILEGFLPLDNTEVFTQSISKFGRYILDLYHPDVSSTYDEYTLSHILTIDGLFFLGFILLLDAPVQEGGFSYFLTGKLGVLLFNAAGLELSKSALVREIFKLENQIPFCVLKDISRAHTDEMGRLALNFGPRLESFCQQHRPFFKLEEFPGNQAPEAYEHLLDLMYHHTVPEPMPERPRSKTQSENNRTDPPERPQSKTQSENNRTCCSIFGKRSMFLAAYCWPLVIVVESVISCIFGWIRKALLPTLGLLVLAVLHALHGALTQAESKNGNAFLTTMKQIVEIPIEMIEKVEPVESEEDVMIASVTELDQAGISFQPAIGGVSSIYFEAVKSVLYLPPIRVDAFSDVIIRNLVAYETLTRLDRPLVFTRYVELMRAIIDTPQDVKLLVEKKIISTKCRNEVVADLFNGMSKAIRDTNTRDLDEVIKKVKAKYLFKQKRNRIIAVYTSGTFLSAIGGLLFLTLTAVQTYCTVYNCSGIHK